MKSENAIRLPLLLFNFSLLTQYLFLSKNKKEYSHSSSFAFGSINKSYKFDLFYLYFLFL